MAKQNLNEDDKMSEQLSKIFIVDKSLGLAGCGLKTDLKIVVKRARKIAKNFSFIFGKQISARMLITELAYFFQEFTYSSSVRPFGLCVFIIGFANEGPDLFQLNPDGDVFYIKANIIGKKSNHGLNFLNKRWNKYITCEETLFASFFSLNEATEGRLKNSDIELAVIKKDVNFKIFNKKEIYNHIVNFELLQT